MRTLTVFVSSLLLCACGGGEVLDSAPIGTTPDHGALCGDPAQLVLGSGSGSSFAPWSDGQSVNRSAQGGSWGLEIRGQASGVHTAQQGSLVLRATWADGGTDDFIAGAALSCTDGSAAVAGFAALPEGWQADPGAHDGETAVLTLTLTDSTGVMVTATQTVVLAAP